MVLGRVSEGGSNGGVPPEQHFSRMKHSPGSGVLSVKVVSDGPTRILHITDENKKVKCLEYSYCGNPDVIYPTVVFKPHPNLAVAICANPKSHDLSKPIV